MTHDPTQVLVLPGVPALLPAHAGLTDPVAELRAAALEGVRLLREASDRVAVVTGPASADDVRRGVTVGAGERVARHLLDGAEVTVHTEVPAGARAVLVVGNGSATRTEKAPGHLDERAEGFDAALGGALAAADGDRLADLDLDLAAQLWADAAPLAALGRRLQAGAAAGERWRTEVLHDGAPYGVQYWVARLRTV
ncbi:hypothetical protein RDV89_13370 [Nocardioides zeae]|uniref:Uncharacterized protein n=1 Tax=Nocardioides imazamoxiresistens TaxID=3231893 RepID=A0ABU3PXV2_9ACTN|nr:hypothetical protein [Nocardioides zeae]MDT9594067.1 hypothetical protein [Nocardioides zeae]